MPTDEQYRAKAKEMYGEMGDVRIAGAQVQRGGGGAEVQIWVYVSDAEFDDIRDAFFECLEKK